MEDRKTRKVDPEVAISVTGGEGKYLSVRDKDGSATVANMDGSWFKDSLRDGPVTEDIDKTVTRAGKYARSDSRLRR